MTLPESFWSFARLTESWKHSATPLKPRRRTAVFTQQHIETIGGASDDYVSPPDPTLGVPRLPVELIVQIVLQAAHELVLNNQQASSARLLELARVNRVCHRAILFTLLLPDLHLYGLQQIRAFAISLDKNRLGIRNLSRNGVRSLTFRARSLHSLQHGYGPALFDASQAQSHFEKDLLPFIRIILSHCESLQDLRIEGVPRGLQRSLGALSTRLDAFDCLMGHYGGDLDRDFWLPNRWTNLTALQLHGPRFRFTPHAAAALASLPQLTRLGLVVPMIVSSPSSPPTESGTEMGYELDLAGRINPLQILIDRSSKLQLLLLVGHGEKDYVGYGPKYRIWLRELRQQRLATPYKPKVRVELAIAIPKYTNVESEDMEAARKRVHPCGVSAWMMGRAQRGSQWFDADQDDRNLDEDLDYYIDTFELTDHSSTTPTTVGTAATSAMMSRASSATPLSARQHRIQQQRAIEAIEAVDMLSDDTDSDEAA